MDERCETEEFEDRVGEAIGDFPRDVVLTGETEEALSLLNGDRGENSLLRIVRVLLRSLLSREKDFGGEGFKDNEQGRGIPDDVSRESKLMCDAEGEMG